MAEISPKEPEERPGLFARARDLVIGPASSSSAPPEERPGISTLVLRFSAVIALISLDLWSKWRVFAFLENNGDLLTRDCAGFTHGHHHRYLLAGEWLTFMKSRNPGAAFGQLDSFPYLLVGGRCLAVLFLIWLIVRTSPARRVFSLALVLVLAGAAGNLWDNMFEDPLPGYPFGAVRDFIDVYFASIGENGWHFPTFNVADSCISVGAVLLLLSGLREEPAAASAPETLEAEEEAAEAEPVESAK